MIQTQSLQMQRHETREAITLESQGQRMFGILHLPLSTEEPVPAVLFCHGFASNKIGKYRFYVSMAEALTACGIAVFRFDYRGSGDSEGSFEEVTLEGEVQDTLSALHFLSNHPKVDPKRIGLLGRSLGGAVSILTASRCRSIRSLVLWAPVFDAHDWKGRMQQVQNPSPGDLSAMEFAYGGIPNPRFLQQFFQMDIRTSLHQIQDVPLLHIHGEQDKIVPITHSLEYQKARTAAPAPTEFIRLPESDHGFSCREERTGALDKSKEWFLATL